MRFAYLLAGLVVLVPACTDPIPPAGPPTIWTRDSWFEGQPNDVVLAWAAGNYCPANDLTHCQSAPQAVLEVDAVRCDGCTVVNDPTHGYTGGLQTVKVIGTTAGMTAVITTDLTYLPTGETSTVSTSVPIDREIGLGAQCALVDTELLHGVIANDGDLSPVLRPCGSTRGANDAVLVFPYVSTLRGQTVFPFLADGATDLSDHPDQDVRPRSTLQFSQPPDGWWTANLQPTGPSLVDFAYFTAPSASISMQTQLTSGSAANATVAVPPAR